MDNYRLRGSACAVASTGCTVTVLYCLPPSTSCLSARAYGFQSKSSQWTRQLVQPRVPLELANWCSQELLNGEVVISPGTTSIDRPWSRWISQTNCSFSLPRSLRFSNACYRSRLFLHRWAQVSEKRYQRPKFLKIFFGVHLQMNFDHWRLLTAQTNIPSLLPSSPHCG